MRVLLPILCYLLAAATFVAMSIVGRGLVAERVREPSRREFWTRWIPGDFTPAGRRLRRKVTVLFFLGLAFLVAGFLIG